MSARTFRVGVTQLVEVTLDEAKFDDAFMEEFRESFFPFQTVERHAEHIAQLAARGIYEFERPNDFIEGYGPANEMGISATIIDTEMEVVREVTTKARAAR